ncbi:long-chain-fatty-acid--CoA ligase [Limibaculum sp. FT325]|uniref:long-chain-fatty-acid--CoA ligase n=1 Tax=Thermohalobaculum sediminis TaxID=2939436 RepID=UPI0020C124A6|nr:long-chain-fatty-acid--CoA ligase [Limibaculum sediminis]MCL5778426.1 long-chain-fatty-acid--CoA ligase [Limibaculum sediminis]
MQDLMQDWPLRVSAIIDHAARYHGGRTIVSRSVEGPVTRTDWAATRVRALKVAQALRRLGVRPGDVVGCMAWNTARHLEAWYGVPGAGAVLHSLNPRLACEQLAYIAGHAGDRWLICDPDLAPIVARMVPDLPDLRGVIVLTDRPHMPEELPGALCFEDLLAAEDGDTGWHRGDERDACGICYTSGTTGHPKGVVYSHRSNVLHAMAMIQPDMLGLSSRDVVMPVVPLFHANGWSTGFSAPMAGAGMVLPGRLMDPASLYGMLEQGVTVTAAVPTIWLPLLTYLREQGLDLPHLDRVVIGGSSCPRAVIEAFQNDYGVRVLHAWGMTETSPLGTFASFKPEVAAMPDEERIGVQLKVGHPPFTVDLCIRDDAGADLPWDGETQGRLQIRGPGVLRRYLKQEADAIDAEGWFDTGDAATIDALGYVRITDRFKDVIKSGGEWISSIDMENAAVSHPDVAEAAAVGVPHPKWDERPVLCIVPKPGRSPGADEIIDRLRPHFAKWQLPDEVLFVTEIPHTATGKISKLTLRRQLEEAGYRLPDLR